MGNPKPSEFPQLPPEQQPPPAAPNPYIQLIYELLLNVFGTGKTIPQIDLVSLTTGGQFQRLTSRAVKKAIIQNISVETVTITTNTGTINQGVLLEPRGSLPCGNIDVGYFWFVRATAGLTLAVYSET